MIKRCFITMTLMMAMFFGGQTISSSQASAQDVWVYSANDGTEYYVMDETVKVFKHSASPYQGTLKTVRNNRCIDKTTWRFSEDEGYVWARRAGSRNSFAIYAAPLHAGNEPVMNRPELLSLYNWFEANY